MSFLYKYIISKVMVQSPVLNTITLNTFWGWVFCISNVYKYMWPTLLIWHIYWSVSQAVPTLWIFRLDQFYKFVYKLWCPCTKYINFGLEMSEWTRKYIFVLIAKILLSQFASTLTLTCDIYGLSGCTDCKKYSSNFCSFCIGGSHNLRYKTVTS